MVRILECFPVQAGHYYVLFGIYYCMLPFKELAWVIKQRQYMVFSQKKQIINPAFMLSKYK